MGDGQCSAIVFSLLLIALTGVYASADVGFA
jgi:hypothetical protein